MTSRNQFVTLAADYTYRMRLNELKPLPIWVLPIKPPAPLPRYIHKVPSDLRPIRSDLPSPLKSPGENNIVSVFQSIGEVTCTPAAKCPMPAPAKEINLPAVVRASTSGFWSPLKSPGENSKLY